MKFIYFSPIVFLVGSLYAQEVTPPPPEADALKPPAKVAPPKAQVIEEDEPVPAAKPVAKPATKPENKSKSDSETQPKQGDKSNAETNKDDSSSNNINEGMPPLSELTPLTPIPEVKKPVNEGIQIQVEKSGGKSGSSKGGGAVKVTSPWPAKPLDVPPLGWKYIPAPAGIEPYRKTVKLGDSDSVNLAITPYVLVPVSDGLHAIRISEPGYQPGADYMKETTIGSILQRSTEEIERNERHTGIAIQRLQQLLSSLPQKP